MSAKTKSSSGAILRRRRGAVAPFRRDLRSERRGDAESSSWADAARDIPVWGRIVLRSATTTLR